MGFARTEFVELALGCDGPESRVAASADRICAAARVKSESFARPSAQFGVQFSVSAPILARKTQDFSSTEVGPLLCAQYSKQSPATTCDAGPQTPRCKTQTSSSATGYRPGSPSKPRAELTRSRPHDDEATHNASRFCPTPRAKFRQYRPTAAHEPRAGQRLAATGSGEIDRISPHQKKKKTKWGEIHCPNCANFALSVWHSTRAPIEWCARFVPFRLAQHPAGRRVSGQGCSLWDRDCQSRRSLLSPADAISKGPYVKASASQLRFICPETETAPEKLPIQSLEFSNSMLAVRAGGRPIFWRGGTSWRGQAGPARDSLTGAV
jgi:hypothetical protein